MAGDSAHIRYVLLFEFESGHPAAEAHRNFSQVFSTEAPSERSARLWFQRFKAGNKKLEAEPRSGRPTAILFEELKNLAEQYPYGAVRYFAASFGCSRSAVSNGFSQNGEKAWSVAPTCIERRLYVNHTHKRGWCAGDEMPDPFVRGGIYENKVMLSVWWGVYGIYGSELLPDSTIVTAEVYCAQLQRLADKIRKST